MLKDNLKDILKHTHQLGFIEAVKVIGDDEETKIEAMSEDQSSVILFGKLNKPIDNFEGTVGFSRMAVLQGYLGFGPFDDDDSEIKIKTEEKSDGSEMPSEVTLKSKTGHKASYRFMGESLAKDHIKVPPFKGVDWDIEIKPQKSKMKELSQFYNILGSYEANFSPTVSKNGTLEFHIGQGATDRSVIPFAEDVGNDTNIDGSLEWPLAEVLGILKLADASADCTMKFSSQGALEIEMDSGLGNYRYILPARSK